MDDHAVVALAALLGALAAFFISFAFVLYFREKTSDYLSGIFSFLIAISLSAILIVQIRWAEWSNEYIGEILVILVFIFIGYLFLGNSKPRNPVL